MAVPPNSCRIQRETRKAMCDCIEHVQAHHCTGSDTVVGSANVSSSIFAMLFVGWLIGLAMGSGLVLYLRRRRRYGTGTKELPLTTSPAAAVRATPIHIALCLQGQPSVAICSVTGLQERLVHLCL